jgi:type III restriction enzyme
LKAEIDFFNLPALLCGQRGGGLREAGETVTYTGAVPDVIAYLQAETELTRATLVRILKESNRLSEFLVNPQRFMDAVAAILKTQLHKLMARL